MVLTLIEHDDGAVDDVSLQTITFARDVAEQEGETLDAVAFGDGVAEVAEELGEFGVDTVYAVDHEMLATYTPDGWARSLFQLVDENEPGAVVAPGSDRGTEVMAHLATELESPMAATCVEVDVTDDGTYELVRQRWGGSLKEHSRLDARIKLLSTVPHEVTAEPTGDGAASVAEFTPELGDEDVQIQVSRFEESDVEGVPLPEARIVIGGGRGVGSAEDFDQLEELADLLGGTVGSTRAAVNEGWRPHNDQIGQTGAKISPELYIAAGLSGAVQHWVGCKGSENILAINTDPEAAIIQKADWAIVADLHEVVPQLIEEIEG